MRNGKQHYYLRVNPVENDGMITSIEDVFDHEPTQEDKDALYATGLAMAKRVKVSEIGHYDKSEHVNVFEFGGQSAWLDKATRVGLVNSLNIEKASDHETTTLYLNGVPMTLPVDAALAMLSQLELYAIDCYRTTEAHKAAVQAMSVIEDVENFDVTADYPEHPVFTLTYAEE